MLDVKKLTGPKAGVVKYDLLTALTVWGLAGSPTFQTSMTRLIALVTARYNWRTDQVSMGQKEIARMWSVNERTVKREMKRLVDAGILIKKRGGVRGRVGAYQLNYNLIWEQSEPSWQLVGPDFIERMTEHAPRNNIKVVRVDFENKVQIPEDRSGLWRDVTRHLSKLDVNIYNNWFAQLEFQSHENDVIKVKAPSAFASRYIQTHLHRQLFDGAKAIFPDLRSLTITF